MSRLLKKAMRDLFKDKRRAVLSLLAILIGTMAFGISAFSYQIIPREIIDTYNAMIPASASIIVDRVDDRLIELTENFEGIAYFEQRSFHLLRVQVGESQWVPLELYSSIDFDALQMNKITGEQGLTHPGLGEMLIERDAIGVARATMGDSLTVYFPNGDTEDLLITGIVGDLTLHPASMHRSVYAYVSYETLLDMGLASNRIDFIITGEQYNRERILSISNEYITMLEQNGYVVSRFNISNTPGISMHLEEYEVGVFLLQVFSFVSFLFGCMIMSNLISTIISGQTRQIGILKGIGASTGKITATYMSVFFCMVVLISIVSVLLSTLLAGGVSSVLLSLGNIIPQDTSVPLYLYVIYIGLALVVPMIIAYFPIRRGVRISVKDAINDYGISADANRANLPEPKYLSRPVLLSLRNAIRRKKRFLLNVAILSIAGAFFVSMVTSMISVQNTLSNNLNMWNFDYQIFTGTVYTDDEISEIAMNIPTAIDYENWRFSNGMLVNEQGELTSSYRIQSLPTGSQMIDPQLLEGRWLSEYDTNQIVISHDFFNDEPNYRVGDTLVMQIGNQIHEFEIVGSMKDFGMTSIFMSEHVFDQYIPEANANGSIKLRLNMNEGARTVYSAIDAELNEQGILVLQTQTRVNLHEVVIEHFAITRQTFLLVIFMFVVVSGFGLAATMNAQISERLKEIGIMKTMGASKKQMIRIITSESIFISLVSWVISILFGIPLAILGVHILANMILETPLQFSIAPLLISFVTWLLLMLIIGYLASRSCAKRTAKLSVKETLTFE